MTQNNFTFEISLSVLNHLGRHLYRSFATVLGEAISNSWDADADSVYIYLDPDGKGFEIVDNGVGMSPLEFQTQFLKVGYSKRKSGESKSKTKKRPFIGRKGIGKLALLSCADRVTVISKKRGSEWIGGVIDNSELDRAITDDLTAGEYPLGNVDFDRMDEYSHLKQGTIIRFDGLKEKSKSSFDFLSKTIALYFRFSLLDPDFAIFLNDEEITHKHLKSLVAKTQFLWKINKLDDPFIAAIEQSFGQDPARHKSQKLVVPSIKGFIASVEKPMDLKIRSTDERVGVDLFVNGRLRERDILKHIPLARLAESYLYGQIHFDTLDGEKDRFTSSREGIVADDPMFSDFITKFRTTLQGIVNQWDEWRIDLREDGDQENPRLTRQQRASRNLYNAVAKPFVPSGKAPGAERVEKWLSEIAGDAEYNYEAYAECFISENLMRKYIRHKKHPLNPVATKEAKEWIGREKANLEAANMSIKIHQQKDLLPYLGMDTMARLVDDVRRVQKVAGLTNDAVDYKPLRNAVAHTSLLTAQAKVRLRTVRDNIAGRLNKLLAKP